MSNTLMGTLQQAIRNTFGCANDFNGDLHVLCDYWGIPMVPISGRTIDVSRKYDASITDATSALNYLLYNPTIAVPALGLNFVNNETLDPRITFSRTSNATQFDSAGNLVYAPHNLLTFSEQFDNAAWGKNAITIGANATAAPDGTVTADKIQETAVTNFFAISSNPSGSYSTAYTHSIYAKAGERTSMQVSFTVSVAAATFNLSNGTVTSSSGSSLISASIQSVGNGWYRCITRLTTVASGANPLFHIVGTVNDAGSTTFAGVAGNGIFIWGAQLNIGTLQPYYPTTVKNALGYSQEFDNAAWTKTNSFVQTNQIRNNTMQGAVAGSPGTAPTNWGTTSIGLTQTVVGTGTENGIAYVDIRLNGTTTGQFGNIVFEAINSVAALPAQTWNCSFYARLLSGSLVNISESGIVTYYRDSGGLYLNAGTTAISVGGTLSRYSGSRTTVASTAFIQPGFYFNTTAASGQAVDFTLRIGWPQLVQGAVAGDPVPTYGTARAVMYPAPDGSVTGDKLVETTAAGQHFINVAGIATISGTPYTASVYMKAAERTFAAIEAVLTTGGVEGVFNLSAGTVTLSAYGGAASPTGSITSVGNGWYRCVVTFTANGASTALRATKLYQNSTTQSYTGDGTSGIYIWGAQLSDSASLDPYVYNPVAAPTAAAYYGPRFDYDPVTLAARGLLIEEQRTNSIRNNSMVGAVAGTPGTLPTNWVQATLSSGLTQQVVGVGTDGGINYIDIRLFGTTADANGYSLNFEAATQIAAANGQSWTASLYLAIVSGSTANITSIAQRLTERSAAGAFLAATDVSITATSSLKNRFFTTRTFNNASTAFTTSALVLNIASGVAIDITLRIGLPQLELGAFATSVIPTTTAAATRTADVASMIGANFSNWYRQDEGTMFVEGSVAFPVSGTNQFLMRANDNTYNNSNAILVSDGGVLRIATAAGGVFDGLAGTASALANVTFKTAGAYKTNDLGISSNGGAVSTDATATIPLVMTRMDFGSDHAGFNRVRAGYLRRIAYYPTRLSNAQLSAITS